MRHTSPKTKGRKEGRKGYIYTVAVTILFLAIHGEIGPGPLGWYILTVGWAKANLTPMPRISYH
jgi:hypothetical protein